MSSRKFPDKKLGRPRKGVDWKNDPERVIVTKFKGWCSTCFEDIAPGEWVYWSSDSKEMRHQDCAKTQGVKAKMGWKIIPDPDRPASSTSTRSQYDQR
jgi:hypothetical protein